MAVYCLSCVEAVAGVSVGCTVGSALLALAEPDGWIKSPTGLRQPVAVSATISADSKIIDSGFFIKHLSYLQIIIAQLDIGIHDIYVVLQAENDDGISAVPRIKRRITALFQQLLGFFHGELQAKAEHDHLIARDVLCGFAAHDLVAIAAVHAGAAHHIGFCQVLARKIIIDQLTQRAEEDLAVVFIKIILNGRRLLDAVHQVVCTLFHFASSFFVVL